MQDKKAKKEPCVFLFDIFTNVRVSLQNVLTFIVTLFPHLCIISRSYLVPVPNQWTKSILQKKCISWSDLSKNEGMITSLIELPELPNFGHMTMSIVKFDWRDKNFLVTPRTKIMTLQPLSQNIFILRRPRVANFTGNIRIATMFVKTIFKASDKIKRIRNYVLKYNLYLYLLIWQKLEISVQKCGC